MERRGSSVERMKKEISESVSFLSKKQGRVEASRGHYGPAHSEDGGGEAPVTENVGDGSAQEMSWQWIHDLQCQEKMLRKKVKNARDRGPASVKGLKTTAPKNGRKGNAGEKWSGVNDKHHSIKEDQEVHPLDSLPLTIPRKRNSESQQTQGSAQESTQRPWISGDTGRSVAAKRQQQSWQRNPHELGLDSGGSLTGGFHASKPTGDQIIHYKSPYLSEGKCVDTGDSTVLSFRDMVSRGDAFGAPRHGLYSCGVEENDQQGACGLPQLGHVESQTEHEGMELLKAFPKKESLPEASELSASGTKQEEKVLKGSRTTEDSCKETTTQDASVCCAVEVVEKKEDMPHPTAVQGVAWVVIQERFSKMVAKMETLNQRFKDIGGVEHTMDTTRRLNCIAEYNMKRLECFEAFTLRISTVCSGLLSCVVALNQEAKKSRPPIFPQNAAQRDQEGVYKRITMAIRNLRQSLQNEMDQWTERQMKRSYKSLGPHGEVQCKGAVQIKPQLCRQQALDLHSRLKQQVAHIIQEIKRDMTAHPLTSSLKAGDAPLYVGQGLDILHPGTSKDFDTIYYAADHDPSSLQVVTTPSSPMHPQTAFWSTRPNSSLPTHPYRPTLSLPDLLKVEPEHDASLKAQQSFATEPPHGPQNESSELHLSKPLCLPDEESSPPTPLLMPQDDTTHTLLDESPVPHNATPPHNNTPPSTSTLPWTVPKDDGHTLVLDNKAEDTYFNTPHDPQMEKDLGYTSPIEELRPVYPSENCGVSFPCLTTPHPPVNKSAADLFRDVEDEFDSLFVSPTTHEQQH